MSSSWSTVFEAIHSSLIDELVEIHPDPKPELGLPIRVTGYSLPLPTLSSVVIYQGLWLGRLAYVGLALDETGMKAIGLDAASLWKRLQIRALKEFASREISLQLKLFEEDPSKLDLTRAVWIPVQLSGGKCFLMFGT